MSVPTSLRVGPFTPTVLVKKRYLIFYIALIWVSIIPPMLEFWFYWQWLWDPIRPIHFYIYLPFLMFFMYLTMFFTSLLFAKIFLVIVNAVHKPKDGVFLRDPSDRDYRYWSLRNTIKRWPVWLAHKFPFPFLDNLCFKAFGVRTTLTNSLFEGWVDVEFIDFGANVVVGQGSIVQSAVIVGNLLIIRKTVIEDNVRIGAHAIVMPGTHIGKNSVLAANSVTIVKQELEDGWIYLGCPAKKFKRNRFFEDGLEDIIGHVEDVEDVEETRKHYEELYIKRHDKHLSLKEKKELKKGWQEEEKIRMDKT